MDHWNISEEYCSAAGMVKYGITGVGDDVVLVHGTPWSSFTWHKLIPVLSQHYRVHYYDFIGYGESAKSPSQPVSLDVQGKLLGELMDFWRLDSPLVLAHDYGGATALRAHLLHGFDFKCLALLDVVALSPWGSAFFSHVKRYEEAFAGVPDYIHQAIVRAYISGAMHKEISTGEIAQLLKPWLTEAGKPAFYRQMAQADQKYTDEVEPLYAQIRCAVSILWGEYDEWIPLETGERLKRAIPHASFDMVPMAGHLAQLENPDFVNSKIKAFFAKHSS